MAQVPHFFLSAAGSVCLRPMNGVERALHAEVVVVVADAVTLQPTIEEQVLIVLVVDLLPSFEIVVVQILDVAVSHFGSSSCISS